MNKEITEILAALQEAEERTHAYRHHGEIADYIPELARVNPERYSLSYRDVDGKAEDLGEVNGTFSIQSVSKIITLGMALELFGSGKVYEYVGVENGGLPFNDIGCIRDKAVNPMVNAGAITITGLLYKTHGKKTVEKILEEIKRIEGIGEVGIDKDVYRSELATATRNRVLAHYLNDRQLLEGDVEEVLDAYICQCAIDMNTASLAAFGSVLASGGMMPSGKRFWSEDTVNDVISIMATCGMYDHSGDYMLHVGIPSKSGVSGCILAVVPGKCAIAVYSPKLNEAGNSYRGVMT